MSRRVSLHINDKTKNRNKMNHAQNDSFSDPDSSIQQAGSNSGTQSSLRKERKPISDIGSTSPENKFASEEVLFSNTHNPQHPDDMDLGSSASEGIEGDQPEENEVGSKSAPFTTENNNISSDSITESIGSTSLLGLLGGHHRGVFDESVFGVMRALMGDLNHLSFGGDRVRFQKLVDGLKSHDDPFVLYEQVNEILEQLLMMDGSLADRIVPAAALTKQLVQILQDPRLSDDLEVHLVACRCLYNLLEVNSDFVYEAINSNAIEALVSKLLNLVYIDLTEQSIQTLEVISYEKLARFSIVANRGIEACLCHLDFLTIHCQRKCLQIVANVCLTIRPTHFQYVVGQIQPLMQAILVSSDHVVIESSWISICGIISNFKENGQGLEELFCNDVIISNMLSAVKSSCNPSSSNVSLSASTIVSIIKSLQILVPISKRIKRSLLSLNVGHTIRDSINGFDKNGQSQTRRENSDHLGTRSSSIILIEAFISCPGDILLQFISLIESFLPEYGSGDLFENCASTCKNDSNSNTLNGFLLQVWSILINSFEATMDSGIKKKALDCLTRIVLCLDNFSAEEHVFFTSLTSILSSIFIDSRKLLSDGSLLDLDAKSQSVYSLTRVCQIVYVLLTRHSEISYIPFMQGGIFHDLAATSDIIQKFNASQIANSKVHLEPIVKETTLMEEENIAFLFSESSSGLVEDTERLKVILSMCLKHVPKERVNSSCRILDLSESLRNILCFESLDEALLDDFFGQLADIIQSGVSVPEFLDLGMIDQLVNVFHSSTESSKHIEGIATSLFLKNFSKKDSQIKSFIDLLQESLIRSESFVNHSCDFASDVSGLSKLLKISLVGSHTISRNFGSKFARIFMRVQPIVTFDAIGRFLLSNLGLIPTGLDNDAFIPKNHIIRNEFGVETVSMVFSINKIPVNNEGTVLSEIIKSKNDEARANPLGASELWEQVQNISFDIVAKDLATPLKKLKASDQNGPPFSILRLLKCIFKMNESLEGLDKIHRASPSDFMNWTLTVKFNKQLQDFVSIASGTLPEWALNIPSDFPFLFPLDSRINFLRKTSFGYSRLIQTSQSSSSAPHDENMGRSDNPLGYSLRRKLRVSRERILDSACKLLLEYGSSPEILEIEFFNEVGTGLGPTLEFYTNVSKELRNCKIWRDDGSDQGLFPVPAKIQNSWKEHKINSLFEVLGIFVARSVLDSRIIDLHLNSFFFDLVLNPEKQAAIFEHQDITNQIKVLGLVDPQLANSLLLLTKFLKSPISDEMMIEDLGLYFVLPGNGEHELVPNGGQILVLRDSLALYIRKVIDTTLNSGVNERIGSFRKGFSKVLPLKTLSIFTSIELKELFGKSEEDWSLETILHSMKANHGYTKESPTIQRFANILHHLSVSERKNFVQFLTGASRLPFGGFKSLSPEFTVVKRYPEEGFQSDSYLPSVMTCANYLKLPEYTLEEVMKKNLLHAIEEGLESFHLS